MSQKTRSSKCCPVADLFNNTYTQTALSGNFVGDCGSISLKENKYKVKKKFKQKYK